MADTRFLHNLQHFPKDNINAETIDLMMPYLNYPMYTYEAAKIACGNVAGLIQWTISMVAFYEINKDVLPLKVSINKHYYALVSDENSYFYAVACVEKEMFNKEKIILQANLAVQEIKYEKANKNLIEAEQRLKEKDDDLKVVQREFDTVTQERQVC